MKCLIQGYKGAFHEEAARKYFAERDIEIIPADSFDQLADGLDNGTADIAIMAIENSIAGSILQNYRILREHKFWIFGEIYLRIRHQLMALANQNIAEINEVISHPMALNQCLQFLNKHKHINRKEFPDTALAAKEIAENNVKGVACIASEIAAKIYGLEILETNIETDNFNYTRFFLLSKTKQTVIKNANQASIYIRVKHEKGSLLNVLKVISAADINMSKLQSFPVLGYPKEYYFYLDLEFDYIDQFNNCYAEIKNQCIACETLGVYNNAKHDMISSVEKQLVYDN